MLPFFAVDVSDIVALQVGPGTQKEPTWSFFCDAWVLLHPAAKKISSEAHMWSHALSLQFSTTLFSNNGPDQSLEAWPASNYWQLVTGEITFICFRRIPMDDTILSLFILVGAGWVPHKKHWFMHRMSYTSVNLRAWGLYLFLGYDPI